MYLWSDEADEADNNDTWKKVIWHSRRGRHLPKGLEMKDLWMGHIAQFARADIASKENYQQIKPSDVLKAKIDGEWRKQLNGCSTAMMPKRCFLNAARKNLVIPSIGRLTEDISE